MNCAPVLIPTLCRYEHLKRCVDSLERNCLSEKTDLFIALDYPLKEDHWRGYNKILSYIKNIQGFKSVSVFKRDSNLGAESNLNFARKEVFKMYDRIIVSEDDNEFSTNFLEFVNLGLEKFEDDLSVVAICGFNFPIEFNNFSSNYYFSKGFSAFGYGTWRAKWVRPYYTPSDLVEFISLEKNVTTLNQISSRHHYNVLSSILGKEVKKGDFAVILNNASKEQFCVFPTISKVRNHGYDGSGINCGLESSGLFRTQIIDTEKSFDFEGLPDLVDENINGKLRQYFKRGRKGRIGYPLLKILYYFYFLFSGKNKKHLE